jgi:hypothetical protein
MKLTREEADQLEMGVTAPTATVTEKPFEPGRRLDLAAKIVIWMSAIALCAVILFPVWEQRWTYYSGGRGIHVVRHEDATRHFIFLRPMSSEDADSYVANPMFDRMIIEGVAVTVPFMAVMIARRFARKGLRL